jgi:hypothetical protein
MLQEAQDHMELYIVAAAVVVDMEVELLGLEVQAALA